MGMRTGERVCPCGHAVSNHYRSGCLHAQWTDEGADPWEYEPCPCERTYEDADLAARAEARRRRRRVG